MGRVVSLTFLACGHTHVRAGGSSKPRPGGAAQGGAGAACARGRGAVARTRRPHLCMAAGDAGAGEAAGRCARAPVGWKGNMSARIMCLGPTMKSHHHQKAQGGNLGFNLAAKQCVKFAENRNRTCHYRIPYYAFMTNTVGQLRAQPLRDVECIG